MKNTIYIPLLMALFLALGKTDGQTLRSAAEPDYPPFSIVEPDGRANGFSVDLLKAAGEAMGLDVDFKTAPWARIKAELADGQLDVLPLVGRTPERERLFDFSIPYLTLHGALFVRADETEIMSLADLSGKRIAVMEADNAEEYVLRSKLSDRIVSTTTFEGAFEMLAAGEADAVIAQKLMGVALLKELGLTDIKVVGPPNQEFKQDFCFAVRKGNATLLATLNEGLAAVMADGTRRRLLHQWIGPEALDSARARRLVFCDDFDFPPYSFIDENGQPAGFNIELLQAIAQETGLDIAFRLDAWSEVRRQMEAGEIDITCMLYEQQRTGWVDYTLPHATMYWTVFGRNDSPPYRSIEDLKGVRVSVQSGDSLQDFAREQGLGMPLSPTQTLDEALRRLAEGRVDFALGYHQPGLHCINRNGWEHLRVAEPRLIRKDYCLVVQKNNPELLNLLNDGLMQLKANGEYRRIYNKWMGPLKSAIDWALIRRYLLTGAAVLLLLAGGTGLWIFSLRQQVRKKTAALGKSEERFEIAVDAANIGVWDRDLVGGRLIWDERMYAIYGIGEGDFGGDFAAWQACVHPDDLERASAEVAAAETGAKPFDTLFRIIRPDGEVRHVRACAKVIYGRDGTPLRMTGTNQDITEQIENEARYKMLFSSMQSGVAIYRPVENNRDFVFVDMNPAGLKYCRIRREQLLDRNVTEVFPGIESSGLLAGLRRVAETGNPEELPLTHYQDERIDQYVENQLFQLASGLVVAVFNDITERKKAELKLQESEEKLRHIIEHSTNMFYAHTPDGMLTYVSPQIEDILGYEIEEVLTRWTELATDHPANEQARFFTQEAIRTAEAQPIYELQLKHKAGHVVWVEVHEAPVVEDGETVALVGSLTDITARKEAEDALRARNRELERFNKASVGRELRMIELKKEVNALCLKAGMMQPYPLQSTGTADGGMPDATI
ncbi:transporter substrate-binding domain-containing protein [Pontiella sp.]|uniref:transporter substrate-binding domain-containing protein n=1 Tax=Pontiella sp. TaxID=2837462 RepID=UPI003565184B